jgi:hypothetical protein
MEVIQIICPDYEVMLTTERMVIIAIVRLVSLITSKIPVTVRRTDLNVFQNRIKSRTKSLSACRDKHTRAKKRTCLPEKLSSYVRGRPYNYVIK